MTTVNIAQEENIYVPLVRIADDSRISGHRIANLAQVRLTFGC